MQFTMKVVNDTWFTQSKADPKDLSDSEKTFVAANTEFAIVACALDHSLLQITLSQPLNHSTQWFVNASGMLSLTPTVDPENGSSTKNFALSRGSGADTEPEKSPTDKTSNKKMSAPN